MIVANDIPRTKRAPASAQNSGSPNSESGDRRPSSDADPDSDSEFELTGEGGASGGMNTPEEESVAPFGPLPRQHRPERRTIRRRGLRYGG
jgi:hypothetical protein